MQKGCVVCSMCYPFRYHFSDFLSDALRALRAILLNDFDQLQRSINQAKNS